MGAVERGSSFQFYAVLMDSLNRSCEDFELYPRNLVQHDCLNHNLKAFSDRLKSQEGRLFNESQAAVDILDFEGGNQGAHECVATLEELVRVLREALRPGQSDPQCRFIFLHAPHSRAALKISRTMLNFLFSYHQVMPSMLDFIFPFGEQIYAEDFHFSGLREESRLEVKRRGIPITELGRSGRELRFCYNLRSVERSQSDPELPWSIRQSAMYHSFDLETGQSLWINIKGNTLIRDRISEATTAPFPQSRSEAFSASLSTHLLFCDWSGENWRWYINDLEDKLRALSGDALVLPIDKAPSPVASPAPLSMSPRVQSWDITPLSRAVTAQSPSSSRTKWGGFSSTVPSRTTTLKDCSYSAVAVDGPCHNNHNRAKHSVDDTNALKKRLASLYVRIKSVSLYNWWRSSTVEQSTNELQTLPPTSQNKQKPPELPPTFSEDGDGKPTDNFTFRDLQRVQYIEDKTQEALLVLRLNSGVLEELRQHYQYATNHSEFPSRLRSNCEGDLARFEKCLLGVEKDLSMLQSRTETLLRSLANRKDLLNCILQYRGIKANEAFAKKAQLSAVRMEMLALETHDITKKTEQETISMRVITTVTLFFLPATFIATFMSTEIVKFENGKKNFQKQGLVLYLTIAVPLTALTFLAWFIYQWVAKKGTPLWKRTSGDAGEA